MFVVLIKREVKKNNIEEDGKTISVLKITWK